MYRYFPLLAAAAIVASGFAQTNVSVHQRTGRSFYLDCGSANANGSGLSIQSPWNRLAQLNVIKFDPGDTISLKRGTVCYGVLTPNGSGAEGAPIRLTAYGEGPRPRIMAPPQSEESLRLFNQQYWDIDSLNLSGGSIYGIFISGNKGILHHIHLSNLVVHDVLGAKMKHEDGGLVAISPGSVNQHFDDVVVDDVTAWNTNQWDGIVVGGGDLGYPPESDWSTNAVIRNSVIHDVQGDGIVLFRVRQGRINSSVAWNTGMEVTQTDGTPNAIWTWMCDECTVEDNEAYLTDSPGVDGGAFDIDYGNTENSVIDNYGHDTQGYCIAVFGAGYVTRQSTVRGNLCINNGRSPRMAKYQGAIFLLSWNGGSIDGLTIENNTVYWNPYEKSPALLNEATIKAGTAIFRDNTIYSTSPWLVDSNASLSLGQNRYIYFSAGIPEWRYGAIRFRSLAGLQSSTQQESGSSYRQQALAQWPLIAPGAAGQKNGWRLHCVVPVSLNAQGLMNDAALRQLTVLKSLIQQYQPQGLQVVLRLTARDINLFKTEAFRNARTDLDLGLSGITLQEGTGRGAGATSLTAPSGAVVKQWNGFVGPAELGLGLRRAMGEPDYAGMESKKDE